MCQTSLICTFSDLHIPACILSLEMYKSLILYSNNSLDYSEKASKSLLKVLIKGLYFVIPLSMSNSALSETPPLNANKIKQDADVMHVFTIILCFHIHSKRASACNKFHQLLILRNLAAVQSYFSNENQTKM